jgi:hypothetical protein
VTRPYQETSFEVLSGFDYAGMKPGDMVMDRPKRTGRPADIPRQVRALSGRRVAIEGFVVPLDFDEGGATEFILNASFDMCSFGAIARPNDWILVRMKDGRRTPFAGHLPVWFYGRLEVGEIWREGRLDSLYRMQADFLGVPADMMGD